MKKLLCGFVCAAVGAALAVDSPTVATVDVIEIDSGLKNTVVAIPGLDLAGDNLVISNLVKTKNLSVGDMLYAFGDDGKYDSWRLNESKHWQHAENKYIITAEGPQLVEASSADTVRMPVGSGIWLSRSVYAKNNPFYVYASHVGEPITIVAATATKLVGNPTLSSRQPTIATPQEGDQVIVPKSGMPVTYTYKGSSWTVQSGWSGETTTTLPSIAAGTGFWYVSNSNSVSGVTISWPAP